MEGLGGSGGAAVRRLVRSGLNASRALDTSFFLGRGCWRGVLRGEISGISDRVLAAEVGIGKIPDFTGKVEELNLHRPRDNCGVCHTLFGVLGEIEHECLLVFRDPRLIVVRDWAVMESKVLVHRKREECGICVQRFCVFTLIKHLREDGKVWIIVALFYAAAYEWDSAAAQDVPSCIILKERKKGFHKRRLLRHHS